jgi:hypothetical protein
VHLPTQNNSGGVTVPYRDSFRAGSNIKNAKAGVYLSCDRTVQLVSLRLHYIPPGKVKVKLSLCLTKHHSMKTYGGVEV